MPTNTLLDRLNAHFDKAGMVAFKAMCSLPANSKTSIARLLGFTPNYRELDPDTQLLLAFKRVKEGPNTSLLCKETAPACRAHFNRNIAASQFSPTPVKQVSPISIAGNNPDLNGRLYTPQDTAYHSALPLVVFFHGGGFVVGDLNSHDETCRILCKYAKCMVLSVDYRLAPEHPAPAAIEDAVQALQWANAHADTYGYDAANISVAGDSAGGCLATMACFATLGTPYQPSAQLLIYPVTDFSDSDSYPSQQLYANHLFLTYADTLRVRKWFVGDDVAQHLKYSPIAQDSSTFAKLPKALIFTAQFDVLRDEAEQYHQLLLAHGGWSQLTRMSGLTHGFINTTHVCRSAKYGLIQIAKELRMLMDGETV